MAKTLSLCCLPRHIPGSVKLPGDAYPQTTRRPTTTETQNIHKLSGWQTIALDTVSCHPNARSRHSEPPSCHPNARSRHPEPPSCHPERSRRVWVRGVGRCRMTGGRFFAALRMTIWALRMTEGYQSGRHSNDRSFHCGFDDSINAIFLRRSQPLIGFSRAMADSMSDVRS